MKNSKFHRVWKVEEKGNMKLVDLGDSKKEKDGSYTNWNWFKTMFVGKAKDLDIEEGDTITIISGLVQKRKYEGKYYDNVVIFEAEITKKAEDKEIKESDFAAVDDDDDIPF